MSLITHPCTRCGHPDFWQERGRGGQLGNCPCGCSCTPGPPEVRPTFDQNSRVIERIVEPGGDLGGKFTPRTCGCKACKALYEQLTAA